MEKVTTEAMKKLLKRTDAMHNEFIEDYKTSMRYYLNENDITIPVGGQSKARNDGKIDELLRSADNRVSSNYHQLIVDQEAGYLTTTPPQIDVEDETNNDKLVDILGDEFGVRLNSLVVYAANAGVAWVHYWKDKDEGFKYGIVPPDQVTPIYSNDLERKLLAVRRSYEEINPATGGTRNIHEYWTDTEVTVWQSTDEDAYSDLKPVYDRFTAVDITTGMEAGTSNTMTYDDPGHIPFIPFKKNEFGRPELTKYKGQIDVYDSVYNGFVNDVDDVQQVILVLTNYGGESLAEFKKALKQDKAVKFESMGTGDKSGLETLTIDIPVDARNSLLETTESKIFKQGQGIDPTKFEANNATGAAIKMLYSHLELKAGNTQAQFEIGISELVKAILRFMGVADADDTKVKQTWTRTLIQNDLERAQILSSVATYSSDEAIAKANPIVEDWQQELQDREDDVVKHDGYDNPDALNGLNGGEDDDDDEPTVLGTPAPSNQSKTDPKQ